MTRVARPESLRALPASEGFDEELATIFNNPERQPLWHRLQSVMLIERTHRLKSVPLSCLLRRLINYAAIE